MCKYLFVIPSLSKGGAERVVSVLSNSLVEKDREVVIVTHFEAEQLYPVTDNVKVVNLSGCKEDEYRKKINPFYLLGLLKKLRKVIKAEKPDYIIPFLWTTCLRTHFALAFSGFKKKIIHTVRNNPSLFPEKKIIRAYRNHLIKHSYKTIVQNQEQKNYFTFKKKDNIFILPNPISESLLEVKRKVSNNELVIVGVGRLAEQKNFDLLIDAFNLVQEKHSNIKLHIFGEGSLRNRLQEKIDKLGLSKKAYLKGRSNNYQEIYGESDIFVLSSNFEGMPNTLLEAMATGLPCISTDCPTGPRDIIKDFQTGILTPVGDVNALAEALEKLLSDDQLRLKLAQEGKKETITNYSHEIIKDRFIEICENR